MAFHWIDPEDYSFNCILLMDRYLIRQLCKREGYQEEYLRNLGIALAYNPAVAWYCREKAPENPPSPPNTSSRMVFFTCAFINSTDL